MQIKLQSTETRGIFTGIIAGKKSIVALTERNRAKAADKEAAVTIAPARIRGGLNLAGELKVPFYVCVAIRVAGRFNNSIAVTYDVFRKIKSGTSDFCIGKKAREIFAADKATVEGAKFEILPAPKARTTKKPLLAKAQAA
jgi:hypothetical protein